MSSPHAAYYDGDVCFLCDLENAVVEREKTFAEISRALRINSDRYLIVLQKVSGHFDGLHCVSGILTVDGKKAAAPDDPAPAGYMKILFFRNECEVETMK